MSSSFSRASSRPALILSVLALAVCPAVPAQSSSRSNSGGPLRSPAAADGGSIGGGVYHNSAYGFSYNVRFGWVDRTANMREDSQGNQSAAAQSQVLLAVFERPPEAKGSTINSAVIIAAESISSYPGLKTAADYFVPLDEVTSAKGFKVVSEPYEFAIAGKTLARADFSKEMRTLTMHQATLVMLKKGFVLSFSFVAGSEEEVEDLIGELHFVATDTLPRSPSSPRKR